MIAKQKIKRLLLRINYHSFYYFLLLIEKFFRLFKIKIFDSKDEKKIKILVIRHGGIGDLLFISATLKHLKSQYSNILITVMTKSDYYPVVMALTSVDRVVGLSWRYIIQIFTNDKIVFLDRKIETNIESTSKNIYELISENYFDIHLQDYEKCPSLSIDSQRIQSLSAVFIDSINRNELIIGIQLLAGSPVRTPSIETWSKIIIQLNKDISNSRFYIIVDEKNKWAFRSLNQLIEKDSPDTAKRLINLGGIIKDTEDLFAAITHIDLVIAPDSCVIHIAGAMKKCAVGLYGPFPSNLRIAHYSNCKSVEPKFPCIPCFTHGHQPCQVAKDRGKYFSPCFEQISPNEVSKAALSLLKRNNFSKYEDYNLYQMTRVSSNSETDKFRHIIVNIIYNTTGIFLSNLNGVEIGAGGAPLCEESIVIDFARPYTKCGNKPIHLKGDSRSLNWFTDTSFDYLYSSHVFEDFAPKENKMVLTEWSRIIKKDGYLILLLPDQRYVQHCRAIGEPPNAHHQIDEFGISYMEELVGSISGLKLIKAEELWSESNNGEYNFILIIRKT